MTRPHYNKVFIFVVSVLLLMSGPVIAQQEPTTAVKPPIAQPLVREGDFAVKLANALNIGAAASETEAESALGSVGIEPRNGWIADYPVTPDIIGELQTAVNEAANADKLAVGKDAALMAFQDITTGYGLSIRTDTPGGASNPAPGANYPEAPVINNYYYDEGPPVVTYYSPPPDYGYMYTWVPYPFWWWNFWYPGYYVLVDFHVRDHGHGRGDHDRFISNHFRDTRSGVVTRIDPANRSRGGVVPDRGGAGLSSPSARSGAQAIMNTSRGRPVTGMSSGLRGYGDRPSTGTRSSVFEHSPNSRLERAASDRGYVSRSNAGRISGGQAVSRGKAVSPGTPGRSVVRGGSGSAPRRDDGGGGSRGDGGGGYHGGGRR